MKASKSKTTATLIALFLVLTIAVTLVALPVANAHTPPWTLVTHTFGEWAPARVGVNQQALIIFWSNWIMPTAVGAMGDRWKFTVDVMKPDGTKDTLGPIISDPVGGGWATYTPTQVGTYTMVVHFPETKLTGVPGRETNINVGDIFLASDSEPAYLTVQQDPVAAYTETPLPVGYWTRPIYGANRYWSEIASSWLGSYAARTGSTTNFAFGEGPESAHVLWTRSYWSGGVMDQQFPSIGYYTGMSYEGFGAPAIILEGQVFYSMSGGNKPSYGWYSVDLYTGETKYYENNTLGTAAMPSIGQILDIEYPNQHGGFPYLWRTSGVTLPSGYVSGSGTSTWELLDGFTGNAICKIANVSTSGTQFRDAIGSVCYLNFVNLGTATAPNYYMQIWNTTEAIHWTLAKLGVYPPKTLLNGTKGPIAPTTTSNDYWLWRPQQATPYDGRNGYSMNVSAASILGQRNSLINQTGAIRAIRPDEYAIVGTVGRNDARGSVPGFLRAYSLKAPNWGSTLWDITFTTPKALDDYPNNTYLGYAVSDAVELNQVDPEDNVFVFFERITRKYYGYSLSTGQKLWETAPENQWNYYSSGSSVYNGTLLSYGGGMANGGILNAYDIKTGKLLWNWTAPDYGLGETWYKYTPLSMGVICDGKAYLYTTEHSATMPLRRDAHMWCVDITTGKMMWALSCWAQGMKIADGRLVVLNSVDNAIYCLGKGPSATTVSAPQTVPTLGSSVMITGTVTDQSPSGRHNVAGSLDFTLKDTPAISDADMEAWMEYMFQQKPMPTDAKGVEVTLDTIDPNGNLVHIGTVTSDITGAYGLKFTPEVPGTYQIIATFAGSKSYGPSFAQTYMGVDEAPPATAAPEYPQPIDNTMTIVAATIAIIITIIVAVALAAVWIKKK